MRVVTVAVYGDIDQVRRRRILPDLGIDAGEVDPLVEPAADPFVAGIGNEVRKAAEEPPTGELRSRRKRPGRLTATEPNRCSFRVRTTSGRHRLDLGAA